jgi:chitodextrinase
MNRKARRQSIRSRATWCVAYIALSLATLSASANNSVHLSYHWHLHQPIYWPDYRPGLNRYQFGADSVDLKFANQNFYPGDPFKHPRNALADEGGEFDQVFTKADRIGAYQNVGRDSIATLLGHPDAGAQVSYSGALQENIWSFGKDNRYGYTPGWNAGFTEANNWLTTGGKPRADMVGITYHHAFAPLLPKSVLRKEIQIFKEIWWKTWSGNPDKSDHSKGFWPPEAAFSETIIPVLTSEGYNWVIIANSHLARTCQNYMQVAQKGTSGWNIDPPNKADVLGPTVPPNQWWNGQIDGRGGAFPAPYAYQAHKAKYVDPNTGQETKITVVPMCDLLSYKNGFASMGTGDIDAHIAPFNDQNHPSIVLMAHDGDNAWGGGSSYYFESVPGLMNEAASKGYHPITIEQFLAWHPVPDNDVVHVEDGAWVNAANDWGHPQYINWLWPPTRPPSNPQYNSQDPRTWYDLETPGWTEDWRNWAVLVAGANFCETAEQITLSNGGSVQAWKIQEPYQKNGTYNNPNEAERAWHFYLGGLDSGFMYYGTSLDDEVKQSIACNRAIGLAKLVTDPNPNLDQTPPTVFKPQRFPWNPGGMGWGPLTGYRAVGFEGKPPWPSDFYIWTHVFDVSGVSNVTLKVRTDNDGVNPLASNQNETYAGGAEVGPWASIAMTKRTIPKGNVTGDSTINFFIEPDYIADYYFAKVIGYRNVLLDYYVEAVDTRGNIHKSDIQHVWVADDGMVASPPGIPQNVTATAITTNQINVAWSAVSGATAYIVKRGATQAGTTSATGFSDIGLTPNTQYCYTVLATNSAGSSAESSPAACATTPLTAPPQSPANLTANAISTTAIALSWSASSGATGYLIKRDGSQIATTSSLVFTNTGLSAATQYCYTLTATNAAGSSAETTPACATTPALPQPPPMPQNLTATAVATNQIDLAWAASTGATGYIVRRGGAQIATTSSINYSDIGLASQMQFCYSVAATNNIGASAFTTNVCATTLAPPQPPTAPTLTVTPVSQSRMDLSWTVSTGATGYVVRRGGSPIATTPATAYSDTGLLAGSNYCYTVTATNNVGTAQSAQVCRTTPTVAPIIIGPGPAIGTDKHGQIWYQEFQDWTASDLRALDRNDDQRVKFNDPYDPGRDLVAFYSREEGGNYDFRVDFFDLLFGAENGHLDVYVLIDCAAGGTGSLPDGIAGTTDHPWEVAVKLYDSVNFAGVSAGNWLGSYWRADLDGVEFGIKRQALLDAGWNGVSPISFQVFSAKDFNPTIADTFQSFSGGVLSGAILSTATTSRAKYAAIAHANQSIATRSQTQNHIYNDLGSVKPGFIRTIDTHEMLGAPLNMHLSGTLISSLLWARQNPNEPGYPDRDGPEFLTRLKKFIDSGTGSLIGGVYAEHIMPYFEGEVNRASIRAFNDLAQTVFGLTTNDMKVMHTPERVMHSNTNWPHANPAGPLKGKPFEDILAGGYVATYLDEVTHLHWWFYPGETNNPGWDENNWGRWAGGGGNDEEPYHHKVHKINGVLTFMINDREDQAKFGNDDGGMQKDTRYTLLDKALNPDYAQITIVFDDWEAYAGNSFGQGANNNADQWHNTIRWAANHPWIEIVNLKDVTGWAQSDTNWVVNHGFVFNKSLQTYEWLKHACEHDYDKWYYGVTGQEENFAGRVPPTAPSGFTIPGTKPYGDLNTPGTLLRDSWDKVTGMPAGNLKKLAEWTYSAMIFETAWHDENPPAWWDAGVHGNWFDAYKSRNYQITFQRPETGSYDDSFPPVDNTAGWALRLHGHARKVGIFADAAQWVQAIKNGAQGATTIAEKKDLDDDLWDEYILRNNRVYLCFKRWGARLLYAFVYDPATQDAIQVIGVPVANPAEEHDGEGTDSNRCSGFKDRWASTGPTNARYVDYDYALAAPVQGSNFWEFVSEDNQIRKRITLPAGRDAVRAEYTLGGGVGVLYVRHGLGPNQLDLLKRGDVNLVTSSDAFYFGLQNTQAGAVYAVNGMNCLRSNSATLPQAGFQNRELPLVEQVEQYNTATNMALWLAFSPGTANDIDGDGLANQLETSLGTDHESADTDGNGMSDGFEYFYFGTPMGNDPTADPDGDGLTNLQEFHAGTAPTNPASVVRITSLQATAGGLVVTWDSIAGKAYRVFYRDDLQGGPGWTAIGPVIVTTGSSTNYTDSTATGLTRRYYRIAVVPVP